MEITILITGIIVGVVASLFYRQLKTSKQSYFKSQLKAAEKEIWDTEFAKFSTMVAYEKQRSVYSQGEDHLAQLKTKLEQNKDDKETKKQIEQLEARLEQLKTPLEEYDMILNGAQPSEKFPEGMRGLTEKLEGIAQKRQNLADFIQLNC